MTLTLQNVFVRLWLNMIEIEGKFCTYLAFIWLFRASLFAWTNLLSTYSLIIHHLCVQKITKIQNYIKKYLMRTKSLFDYDHEGTKNNKNDIFNYTQVYLKKYSFFKNFYLSNWASIIKFFTSACSTSQSHFQNAILLWTAIWNCCGFSVFQSVIS